MKQRAGEVSADNNTHRASRRSSDRHLPCHRHIHQITFAATVANHRSAEVCGVSFPLCRLAHLLAPDDRRKVRKLFRRQFEEVVECQEPNETPAFRHYRKACFAASVRGDIRENDSDLSDRVGYKRR
jgi:hypothetical protein